MMQYLASHTRRVFFGTLMISLCMLDAWCLGMTELSGIDVVSDIDGLCGGPNRLDLVVECAGQGAVARYGKAVLERGVDLAVISSGAYADVHLHQVRLRAMGV